uniref:Uncharacterized protein n=1 Tax=Labrus bergylta TaxID=56723 RepID=A0A3Q3GML8_9LABR
KVCRASAGGLFLVLCSVLTPNLCCDWVKRFGHLNGQSLDAIEHMGGPLTEEKGPVLFPNSLYKRIRKLVFIRDSLKLISDLYRHDNLTSVTWDVKKLVEFQAIIHRQVEELNTCVGPNILSDALSKEYCKANAKSYSLSSVRLRLAPGTQEVKTKRHNECHFEIKK